MVTWLADGLLALNQISMEFEGVAADNNLPERQQRLRDMEGRPCMIMRNHGLLTVGRMVAQALY